jgi:hypothetical protein
VTKGVKLKIIGIILIIVFITIILVPMACSSQAPTTPSPTSYTPTRQIPTTSKTTPILTPSPSPSPTAQFSELPLQIVSVTSPVSQGADSTLVAQTVPGAECKITVYYESGQSAASGLSPKTADDKGQVSWTWTVGPKTTIGSWKIVIMASNNGVTGSQTTYFEVK